MTMQVSQALEILGAKRVIWIDDRFNTTPAQLADLYADLAVRSLTEASR